MAGKDKKGWGGLYRPSPHLIKYQRTQTGLFGFISDRDGRKGTAGGLVLMASL